MRVTARGALVALGLGVAASAPAPARAEPSDQDPCMSAGVEGQIAERRGQLLEARKKFVGCAQAHCPSEVLTYCTKWLADVNANVPSVVIAARDGSGRDITDVRVIVDGVTAQEAIDGRSLELDPGAHQLRFERRGHAPVGQTVVVREHEQGRRLVVTIADPPPPGSEPRWRPPIAAWVLGGVGLVSMGVFTYATVKGVNDRSRFGCATLCAQPQYDQVSSEFLVADIALGVGLAGLAGSALLLLTTPRASDAPRVEVHPVVGGAYAGATWSF